MVRYYARSVGTLPNKGNKNGTVVQGAFKRENPQKPTKSIGISTILTNVTTEKQLSHSRLGTDIFQGKWSVLIADWQMSLV
jgi:hypothetical protein